MTKPDTCVPVDPTLAESLRQGEASSRAEGVDPNDSTVYLNIKRRLLAGEITLDEAHVILDDCFTEDDVVAQILPMLPRDDVWRGSDYDDEPRSNGNCGLDPFQQECENAAKIRPGSKQGKSYTSGTKGIMHILVEMPGKDLKLLDLVVKRLSISRAQFIQQAIATALMPHRKKMNNDAFGSWSSHTEDGLQYQDRVRAEW